MNQSSKVQNLIDSATSNELSRPDQNLNAQVIQEINTKSDTAKLAAAQFKKRFQTKEPRVVALTLELLEKAMLTCGNPLHIQIGTKEFMNVLVTLLNQKNFPPVIQERILSLIQKWGMRFEKDKDILPLFSEVYSALKARNVPFPQYVPDSVPQQQQPQKSQQQQQPKAQEQRRGTEAPNPQRQNQSSSSQNGKVSSKYQKLLGDMNLVKGNINLTNMMLDTAKPSDVQSEDNPINDLVRALKDMEPKLFELLSTLDNEEMMKVCLLVNDDLHKTFQRYEKLKKGKKPEVFQPGESQQQTVLVPTTIYEKPEVKAQRQRAQQQQQQQQQQQSRPQPSVQNNNGGDLLDMLAGGSSLPIQQQKPAQEFFTNQQPVPIQQFQQPQAFQQPQQNFQQPLQQQPVQMQKEEKKDILSQLNQIMQNMTDLTNDSQKQPQQQSIPNANQFGTNVPSGMNQFGTNMPMGGGYNQYMTGMGGMGMQPPMGQFPGAGMNQFGTNMGGFGGMNPGMGAGFGMGMGMGTNMPMNQPPTSFNNVFGTSIAPTVNQSVLDSFKKDGFNFGGYKAPEKKQEDEGSKEFADLFNIADSKIKDRKTEKPQYDLNYNPIQVQYQQQQNLQQQQPQLQQQPLIQQQPIQQQHQQFQQQPIGGLNDAFNNMNLGQPQVNAQVQQQNHSNDLFGSDFGIPTNNNQQQQQQLQMNQNNNDIFGASLMQSQPVIQQQQQHHQYDMGGNIFFGGSGQQQHQEQHNQQDDLFSNNFDFGGSSQVQNDVHQQQQQQNFQPDVNDLFSF